MMTRNVPNTGRRAFLRTTLGAGFVGLAGCVDTGESDLPAGVSVETVAEDFVHPWGLAFLPESRGVLVTEREGRLRLLDPADGRTETISGTPDAHAAGQGGLLDVTLHPEFEETPWVYLTYAARNDAGASATHLGRGLLDADGTRLADFELLRVAEPFVDSTGHYGSRVTFAGDGTLYVTVGDRQFDDFGPEHVSQNRGNELGATLRLEPDGSIPADNPFLDDPEAVDSLYTYGHRNAQGMSVHPETGEIWQSEHGQRDGDELNVLEAGGNYGWPVTHYGCEYGTEQPIGELPHERDDVVDPVYYWECKSGGFPPAGMTFYDGDAFPDWQGDLFVGNLAGQYLGRFTVDGREVTEEEPLLEDEGWRIRAVAVDPASGHLYVVVDESSAPIVRLVPT